MLVYNTFSSVLDRLVLSAANLLTWKIIMTLRTHILYKFLLLNVVFFFKLLNYEIQKKHKT